MARFSRTIALPVSAEDAFAWHARPGAFERLRPFLTEGSRAALVDPRLRLHFLDGRRYLNGLESAGLDLVLALHAVLGPASPKR